MTRASLIAIACCAAVCLAASSGTAAAQSVSRDGDGRLSIEARDVSAGALFRELASAIGLERLMLDPNVDGRLLTLSASALEEREALELLLDRTGLDFVILGGGGHPLHVFVGDLESAVEVPIVSEDLAGSQGAEHFPSGAVEASPGAAERDQPAVDADGPGAGAHEYVGEFFSMDGENVTYNDPDFVTYKMSEAARRARMKADVSKIP